jgi:Putative Flp pilus-assembly TadE/G-like
MIRLRGNRRHQDGAVSIMIAIWLPLLAVFTSFAIDVAHWFDYSRNLQNRADAAALAAGDAYGGTCFGTPTQAALDAIGQTAQQFAGPPNGTPDTNLPYLFASVSNYQNQPNLSKGTPANLHLLLNSTTNWSTGADWNMGSGSAAGTSAALCSSTDEDGNTGAMTDVRITQAHLGLFLPLIGVQPTISAHARVELKEGVGENGVTPIAVRDDAATRCVDANFFNASTKALLAGSPVAMTKEKDLDPNNGNVIWDIPAGTSIPMPSNANVYVQFVTGPCGAIPQTFDAGSGLLYVNGWSTNSAPAAPVITTGGVTLTPDPTDGPCPADFVSNQYFTDGACTVTLTANVLFPTGNGAQTVTATDSKGGNYKLTNVANTTKWTSGPITIDPATDPGQHLFSISAKQGNTTTSLGPQQQAFAACNDQILGTCNNPPDDSGPIVLAQIGLTSAPGSYGENAFAQGSSPNVNVTIEIQGLHNASAGDPPTVLRFTESGAPFRSHATGLVDCGQGSAANADALATGLGCPTVGTSACSNFDFCAPLLENDRANSACTPAGNSVGGTFVARTATAPMVPVDCVSPTGGQRPPSMQGIACRVILAFGGATTQDIPGCVKTGNPKNTVCSSNNWSPTTGSASVPGDDPRAMTMIITAPADLNSNNGPPVPIETFATFYVTGWSTIGGVPGCDNYAAAPPGVASDAVHVNECSDGSLPNNGGKCPGNQGQTGGEIWGYWIKYSTQGIPGPTNCDSKIFGICVPALTR